MMIISRKPEGPIATGKASWLSFVCLLCAGSVPLSLCPLSLCPCRLSSRGTLRAHPGVYTRVSWLLHWQLVCLCTFLKTRLVNTFSKTSMVPYQSRGHFRCVFWKSTLFLFLLSHKSFYIPSYQLLPGRCLGTSTLTVYILIFTGTDLILVCPWCLFIVLDVLKLACTQEDLKFVSSPTVFWQTWPMGCMLMYLLPVRRTPGREGQKAVNPPIHVSRHMICCMAFMLGRCSLPFTVKRWIPAGCSRPVVCLPRSISSPGAWKTKHGDCCDVFEWLRLYRVLMVVCAC